MDCMGSRVSRASSICDNLAHGDLVDLMLNTSIPTPQLVEWVDQAMLYVQLGPEPGKANQHPAREALRAHGIRTATGLLIARDGSLKHGDEKEFEQLLGAGASGTRQRVRTLVDAIEASPNLEPVLIWKGIARAPAATSLAAAATPVASATAGGSA